MSRKWNDLSPRTRKLILVAAVAEAGLKAAVLLDLKRRAPDQVRGSRSIWAASMVVNSFGVVPMAYFVFGRRPRDPGPR
jgi:hypothetical protein